MSILNGRSMATGNYVQELSSVKEEQHCLMKVYTSQWLSLCIIRQQFDTSKSNIDRYILWMSS